MADLSITPSLVVSRPGARTSSGLAGEAITQGKIVNLSAGQRWMLADNEALAAGPIGIALNQAALNQPLRVQTAGGITIGATLTPGEAYSLSSTPGGICTVGSLAEGQPVVLLGLAQSTTLLAVSVLRSEVDAPPSADWILANGVWDDSAPWDDTQLWKDAA